MAATPIYALPYPVPSDPADVPADIQALANRLEVVLPTLTPPTSELAYAEITANVSVAATAEGTPTDVISAPAVTLDGNTFVLVEFYCARVVSPATAAARLNLNLWDMAGPTNLGFIAWALTPAAGSINLPIFVRRKLKPAAGSHTFRVRGWNQVGAWTVGAGAGGAGNDSPASIRVTRA